MGMYTILESINQKYIFIYVVIILVFILYFRKKVIGINVLLALFIAYLVIWYIYEKNNMLNIIEEKQQDTKFNSIIPKPKKIREYDDILDLIFSIQDFYAYNPQAYEELIDNLDSFFIIYEKIFITQYLSDHNYQIAESKKQNALNVLHSLIFKLPNNKIITDKLNRAHKRLETLLNRYLNELYDKCREKRILGDIDINTRAINIGPKEYNTYTNLDKEFTYQIY